MCTTAKLLNVDWQFTPAMASYDLSPAQIARYAYSMSRNTYQTARCYVTGAHPIYRNTRSPSQRRSLRKSERVKNRDFFSTLLVLQEHGLTGITVRTASTDAGRKPEYAAVRKQMR